MGWEEVEPFIIPALQLLMKIEIGTFKNATKASMTGSFSTTIKQELFRPMPILPLSLSLSLISNLLPSAQPECKSQRRLTCSPKLYLLTFSNV